MKYIFQIFFILLSLTNSYAQEKEFVHETFRFSRLVNGHTVETSKKGDLEFILQHRFGTINSGAYELFGLDQASMRLGLDYGINNRLTVGMGRSTFKKYLDGFLKYRIIRQTTTQPLSTTLLLATTVKGLKPRSESYPIAFYQRFSYTSQLILASKFTEDFSLQIIPTYFHDNIVKTRTAPNDVYAIGFGAKYQASKNIAITIEYFNIFNGQLSADKKDPLSIGIDLNTGSHVFQIHFSNSAGMIEKAYITETTGKVSNADIHLGFNLIRTFRLKGRRY